MGNLSDRAGAPKFDSLSDTPSTKVAGQFVKANAGGTALEYELVKQPSAIGLTPTSGAVALDWDASTVFSHALAGNTTFTSANQSGGVSISVTFTATATGTPTFPGVVFPAGNTPDELTSGQIAVVTLIDDGIRMYGVWSRDFA